jgi:hypothetical protein
MIALRRSDWLLPKANSAICTIDFLSGIINGTQWCPKMYETRIRYCENPPKKIELIIEVNRLLREKNIQFEIDPLKPPD